MSLFLAGVAVRDITPAPGIRLWGYRERTEPATGVLDPLYAKAVVFRAGDSTAAVVSVDLGRPPMEDVCSYIQARAREAGVDQVFLTATHTHHGPEMDVPNAPHIRAIADLIADAIEEAAQRAVPARLGVGSTRFDIAHNRRRILDDGRCAMLWRNEERIPTEPVDRQATIVRIETVTGQPMAMLVHFACHPVVMGDSNTQYSADYVGEMAAIVKQRSGFECVFLQGATGDINPYLDKTAIDDGAVEAMRGVGRTCAEAVLAALPGIDTVAPESPCVAFNQKPVSVGARWDMSDPAQREICFRAHGGAHSLFSRYHESLRPDLQVPLTVLVVNDQLAFVGMPGEVFVSYQLMLKSNSPVSPTLLCGYTNGYHAYFPTVRDALAGGYGGSLASYVGIGAADKLATEAQIEIARLLGRINAPCTFDDFRLLDLRDIE